MEATAHPLAHTHDPAVRALATVWWHGRRELRQDAVWMVPFPPRGEETVRVTHDGDANQWYAALLRPRALTAYIEVHNSEGPIDALVSLYEHVV